MRKDQLKLKSSLKKSLEIGLRNVGDIYGDKFENEKDFFEALEKEMKSMWGDFVATQCLIKGLQIKEKSNNQKLNEIEATKEMAIFIAMEAIQVACICTKYLQEDK